MLLAQQLEGTLTYERLDGGLRVRLRAPAVDVRWGDLPLGNGP